LDDDSIEEESAKYDMEAVNLLSTNTSLFDGGDSSAAYMLFKELLHVNSVDVVMVAALKTMELLLLGKLEKGSMSLSSKVKPISDRWFN
jgi:hypothetical protein